MLEVKDVYDWAKEVFPEATTDEPLVGIAEELGEYQEQILSDDPDKAELIDALADAGIYTFHLCGLTGIEELPKPEAGGSSIRHLVRDYGRVCHVLLKRKQKIRGMQKDETYKEALGKAVNGFWATLYWFAQTNMAVELPVEMDRVFKEIVSKRTLKSQAAAGSQVVKDQGSKLTGSASLSDKEQATSTLGTGTLGTGTLGKKDA